MHRRPSQRGAGIIFFIKGFLIFIIPDPASLSRHLQVNINERRMDITIMSIWCQAKSGKLVMKIIVHVLGRLLWITFELKLNGLLFKECRSDFT